MPWQAIQYVTSALSLVAFLAAAVAVVFSRRSSERARLIETAKPEDRADLIRDALEFFHVDTANLTKEKQFKVALEQIRARSQRFKITAAAVCVLALAFLALAAFAISKSATSPELVDIVKSGNEQVKLDLWRSRYGIGQVSGSAWIVLDLRDGGSTAGLTAWLNRVEKRYADAKVSNVALDSVQRGGDVKGDEYLEINALSSPKKNWDLIPVGKDEAFVDELLFNSRFVLLATSGEKRGLLLSPLSFSAEATSVKIYFDPATRKPNKIEGHAEGKGAFSPVPGQFNGWVDFYGSTLIARQLFLVSPLPEAFALVHYQSIAFHSKDNQWSPSATFAIHTGADLLTDERRSLIVTNADWKTLGSLPRDYPGKRLALYGAPPDLW